MVVRGHCFMDVVENSQHQKQFLLAKLYAGANIQVCNTRPVLLVSMEKLTNICMES